MRTMMALLVVAAAATAAFGEDEKVEKDKKKFAGTWQLVSGEVDGKAVADEDVKRAKITFDGDKRTLTAPHLAKDTFTNKTKRIDPSKKPAEMDWLRESGPGAGTTMLAIYEFVDDDTYRCCYDPAGKERPKEFKTAAGTGYILHVWKRVK
jgi:uncharacterized protein (TIGR03067 family)